MCTLNISIFYVESQDVPIHTSYCLESSLNITKAKGKVLVCRHAGSSTESKLAKGAVVKEAGGVGMILIDEADRDVAIPFAIPAAIVGNRVGYKILSYINNSRFSIYSTLLQSLWILQPPFDHTYSRVNSNPTSTLLSAKTVLGLQAAPRVAPFSSKGPNALTPEILKVTGTTQSCPFCYVYLFVFFLFSRNK